MLQATRTLIAGIAMLGFFFGMAAAQPAGEEKKVEIGKKGFSPEKLEVKVGQKVLWTNTTDQDHTVTSNEKAPGDAQDKPMFDSGPIKPGATWEYAFDKAGSYGYHCSKEKTMTGMVMVK